MRSLTRTLTRGLLLGGLALAGVAGAEGGRDLVLKPGAKLTIDGTSTVRRFTCRADTVEAQLASGPGALNLATLPDAVKSAVLTFPAMQLHCGDGTMDEHMRNALHAKEHPAIRFRMTGYDVGAAANGQVPVSIRGELQLSGQTHPITVQALAREAADGTLQVEGQHELRMTDWGVQPPTLMFGAMRVGESVTLKFQLALVPPAQAARASQE